ncbi:MAG: NFACT family protein, partial [Bacteroidota bacterium]
MPFDALTLGAVRRDLARRLLQARLDRIFQPGRSELVFVWRRGNEQYRMQFGAEAPGPWLGLVDSSPENPANPPAFCMLLRKYLSGGRLLRLVQPPFERRIALVFEHYDELVGLAERALHLELMGRRGNAVLTEA